MSHNRIRASKSTYDNRSQRGVETRKLPGTAKQPLFKWGGGGRTNSAEARAYVAQCRQREIEKMHRKDALKMVPPLTVAEKLARGVDRRLGAVA